MAGKLLTQFEMIIELDERIYSLTEENSELNHDQSPCSEDIAN